MTAALTIDLAEQFARLALNHVQREYPHKQFDHIMNDASDVLSPRQMNPLFYGSFDWHSCVHGYWLLARMLRRFPQISCAERIRACFDAEFTAANIEGELAYLRHPNRGTFERPYGWGWILMLASELARSQADEARRWSATLQPLADEFVARFREFVPKATYPVRVGTHYNSSFACSLALEYADVLDDSALRSALCAKALSWYGNDADCQAWEPGGDDFLSSALMEAVCMQRALPAAEFLPWFDNFLPRLASREPATLFTPATVSDRTDGKIGHLDGLNFSRAWCWRSLASSLPSGDARHAVMIRAADAHIAASLPHVAGDYMGEHWLATFATLALDFRA